MSGEDDHVGQITFGQIMFAQIMFGHQCNAKKGISKRKDWPYREVECAGG